MVIRFLEWLKRILLLIFCVGMIFLGIVGTVLQIKFEKNALTTTATVERVAQYTDEDDKTTYKVFVYYTVNGITYRGSYQTYSYISQGSTTTIYYDKTNPSHMEKTTLGMGIGIALTVAGVVCLILVIKFRKEE